MASYMRGVTTLHHYERISSRDLVLKELRIFGTEMVLAFPCGFPVGMVRPLHFQEFDRLVASLALSCFKTPECTIDFEEIDLQEDLSYHEHPVAILEETERKTRNKSIKFLKVKWSHHSDREATWEREDHLRSEYPEFFQS